MVVGRVSGGGGVAAGAVADDLAGGVAGIIAGGGGGGSGGGDGVFDGRGADVARLEFSDFVAFEDFEDAPVLVFGDGTAFFDEDDVAEGAAVGFVMRLVLFASAQDFFVEGVGHGALHHDDDGFVHFVALDDAGALFARHGLLRLLVRGGVVRGGWVGAGRVAGVGGVGCRFVGDGAEGGVGQVYMAVDTRLGRMVALKFLRERMLECPGVRSRFRREALIAAGLSHPNICTIYDIDEHRGDPYIVMEFLKGRSLDEHVPGARFDTDAVLEVSLPLLDALAVAHARGIVHRDVKPANVFVTDQGNVKLLDFGLARAAGGGPPQVTHLLNWFAEVVGSADKLER